MSEKDISKVRCFSCHNIGHYAFQCPNKKEKKKGVVASTEVDEFSTKFDIEFALMVSIAISVTSSSLWFVDSGASCHMTGVREHFMSLAERDIDLEVVLGDNSKVRPAGVGTVSIQSESLPPLKVIEFLFVPGLQSKEESDFNV